MVSIQLHLLYDVPVLSFGSNLFSYVDAGVCPFISKSAHSTHIAVKLISATKVIAAVF